MIRTLIAHDRALVRGALAFVLSAEADIEVVADLERAEEFFAIARSQRTDVAIADVDLFRPDGTVASCCWPRRGRHRRSPR